MRELGSLMGFIIVILYILALLNYVVKFLNRKWVAKMNEQSSFRKGYQAFMRFIVRNHKLFGFLAVIFLLVHFIIQFTNIGPSPSGVLAGSLLILQAILGIYGAKAKNKGKAWLYGHRTIAVVLLVAIIMHVA